MAPPGSEGPICGLARIVPIIDGRDLGGSGVLELLFFQFL
jgi:hypothetical protein